MNHYSFSLVSKQKSDAEKLLARAEELMKEQDPAGNSGVEFDLFESDSSWGIGVGGLVPEQADLAHKIIIGIVSTFPEMSLHYVETCNGPVCHEAVTKDGKLVGIEPWEVVVHMQNEEDYKQVIAYLQENTDLELTLFPKRCSIQWPFDGKMEDDMTTERLNELSRQFPEMLFQCYKYDERDEMDGGEVAFFTSFRGQEVEWEESWPKLLALMHWAYDLETTYEDIIFNTEQVFQTALAKARADEDWYPRIVSEYLFFDHSLHSLVPEDFTWLKALADHGIVPACCLILLGMDQKSREWEEAFTDEDTGEEVKIIREEIIDGTLFEPDETLKKQLTQIIYEQADHHRIGTNEIRWACKYPLDYQPLLLMLVERGEEDAAGEIEDPAVLQKLCDKGNKWAAYALYYKYRWGDEEHGIFINKERAKEYYDLTGDIPYKEEWIPIDEAGEEYPSTYEYILTGDATTLDGIEKLIRDLCQRFGIPENEEDGLGLYVPQRQLMKVLVGSDTEFYRGNVMYLNREVPDRLVITTESDNCEPLLYALRWCYEYLSVEMKKAE